MNRPSYEIQSDLRWLRETAHQDSHSPSEESSWIRRNLRRRAVVFFKCKGLCFFCSRPLKIKNFTIDHLVPIARGGGRKRLANMVASCVRCNKEKADRPPTTAELEKLEQFNLSTKA